MSTRKQIKTAIKQIFDDHIPSVKAYDYVPSYDADGEKLAIIESVEELIEQRNISKALRNFVVVIHLIWYTTDPEALDVEFENFIDEVVDQLLAHRAKPGQPALHGLVLDFGQRIRVQLDPTLEEGETRLFSAHIEVEVTYETTLT